MKNLELINAGAGSGKTFRLTEKVVDAVESGVPPSGLVATTFTIRAASELRERIRLGLLARGCRAEARQIYEGLIGTVNSVCGKLLTEYALEAGLSPALQVLPEEDSEELFNRAISDELRTWAAQIEPAARRLSYDGMGSNFNKNLDWRDDVRTIVALGRANLMGPEALRSFGPRSMDAFFEPMEPALGGEDLTSLLRAEVQEAMLGMQGVGDTGKASRSALQTLMQAELGLRSPDTFPWSDWARLSKLRANVAADHCLAPVRSVAERFMDHPLFRADLRTLAEGVFECAADALSSYGRFKREQGLMDFVDQERQVLELAREHEPFRAALSDRLKLLMVDEFQDTSPIQLALFLELSRIVGRTVWVGDPKQAIYGFRGTDPELMNMVAAQIPNRENLAYSWRSRQRLVSFSNAVFSEVFQESDENPVSLSLPEERQASAHGGWIDCWQLVAKNDWDEADALAAGVQDMLQKRTELSGGDVAILCRTNAECERVAASLGRKGIRASASSGSLIETPEGRLALAALQYLSDAEDTVALATMIRLMPARNGGSDWLPQLLTDRNGALGEWRRDPRIQSLDETRSRLVHLTPLQALEEAMDGVELPWTVLRWGRTRLRRGNLDLLRGLAAEYQDRCRTRREPAELVGLVEYIEASEAGQVRGTGEQTVQVLTYHKAKGLEWPVVILSSLGTSAKVRIYQPHVVPSETFDPADPLANRWIRFWPWGFGRQRKVAAMANRLEDGDEASTLLNRELREARRLLYVGMTRARDGMVLALRKTGPKSGAGLSTRWLDELMDRSGEPVIRVPKEIGPGTLRAGSEVVQVTVRQFGSDQSLSDVPPAHSGPESNVWILPERSRFVGVPAGFTASGAGGQGDEGASHASVSRLAALGPRIPLAGSPDPSHLGGAVHGFLGVEANCSAEQEGAEEVHARSTLSKWGLERVLTPEDLIRIRHRLEHFLSQRFPGARILREWPVTLRTPQRQLMHGWIDLLLELPKGFVIIDHKSYPGEEGLRRAQDAAAQLALYRQAVEMATGRPVLETLIHLPLVGEVIRVRTKGIHEAGRLEPEASGT